jgi:hypothetical protein
VNGLQLSLIRRELTHAQSEIERLEAVLARTGPVDAVLDVTSGPPQPRHRVRPEKMVRSYGWLPDVELGERIGFAEDAEEAIVRHPRSESVSSRGSGVQVWDHDPQ